MLTREEAELLRLPFRELGDETKFPELLLVPQSTTERVLLAALEQCATADVRFGARVTEARHDATGATVAVVADGETTMQRARFVVGCDGAHSTIRERLRLRFPGRTYAVRAALADVRVPGCEDAAFPRLTTDGVLAIGLRIAPGLWRVILRSDRVRRGRSGSALAGLSARSSTVRRSISCGRASFVCTAVSPRRSRSDASRSPARRRT